MTTEPAAWSDWTLRERVAWEIDQLYGVTGTYKKADRIIALVLEEAAKVARGPKPTPADAFGEGYELGRQEAEIAIRTLIPPQRRTGRETLPVLR
jgi:hypothetical protein